MALPEAYQYVGDERIQMLAVRCQVAIKQHECDVIGCGLPPINVGERYYRYAYLDEANEFRVSKQHMGHYASSM